MLPAGGVEMGGQGERVQQDQCPQSQAQADWALGLAEQQASLRLLAPSWSDFSPL